MSFPYSTFAPMVAVKLPKAVPEQIMAYAIREACRRFAIESKIWVEELAAINVVADQQDYDLSHVAAVVGPPAVAASGIPANSEAIRLDSVKVDDAEWSVSYRQLNHGNILHFLDNCAPATASTGGLVVTAVVVPELVDDALPDEYCSRWRTGIVAAAVAFLAGMKKRPYSDMETAAIHEGVFIDEVSSARFKELTGGNKAEVYMRPAIL